MDMDATELEAAGVSALLAACPTFETFWQGRLIPGACVDTLPFIRSVRLKRSAAAKDLLPDEVFNRIRGALFLGPGFRVTRNKLTFRDNLALLLESGSPLDRQLERKAKEWLVRCHKELDRTIKFEALSSAAMQAKARSLLGADVTVFERICDGLQGISKGDIVRLNTKPAILGRVEHFSIPQIVHAEGCYSGGRVTVCALPTELLGPDNLHTWPLRRLEGKVAAAELAEHVSRELGKLPASLQFEPMKLCGAGMAALPAGACLPETSIAVLNGSQGRVVKALLAGRRHHLEVVQTLYYLGPAGSGRKRTAAAAAQRGGGSQEQQHGAAAVPPGDAAAAGKKSGGKKASKRRRKGGGAAAAGAAPDKENEAPAGDDAAATASGGGGGGGGSGHAASEKRGAAAAAAEEEDEGVPEGEVVLSVDNRSPLQDCFQFQRINGGLTRAGCYVLQYSLHPELPSGRTLRFSIDLEVAPGPPVGFDIRGEGRAIAMTKSVLLGEALPPLQLLFQDAHGNAVPPGAAPPLSLQVLEAGPGGGGAVLQELAVAADTEVQSDGHVCLTNLRVLAAEPPGSGSAAGLALFRPRQHGAAAAAAGEGPSGAGAAAGAGGGEKAQRSTRGTVRCGAAPPGAAGGVPMVRAVDVFLAAHVEGMPQQGFLVRLAPGAPHTVRLLAGHPFSAAAAAVAAADDAAQPLLTQLPPVVHKLAPAVVLSGEQLPAFKVQVLDAWGNATCPSDALPFEVHVQCGAAEPPLSSFGVDERGVATISGVGITRLPDAQPAPDGSSQPPAAAAAAASDGDGDGAGTGAAPQAHELTLWPQVGEGGAEDSELLRGALAAAEPVVPLALAVSVLPSEMPAELLMTYKGEELARKLVRGPDGEETLVWQLGGVEAGGRVKGLCVRCVDEVGRPAAVGVKGKVQVSWAKGFKAGVLSGTEFKLPPLTAQDSVGDPQPFWVRFVGDKDEWPDVSLDIQFEVSVVAGPPVTWGVGIVDRFRTPTAAAAAAAQPEGVPQDESLGMVPCGRPFTLEIEAIDAHHNRCTFTGSRPSPVVRLEPLDPEAQLTLEPDSWVSAWGATQAGGEVCQYKLWLAGPPGPVRVIVTDESGEGGAPLLAPDELTIQLMPGPPAALLADCPPLLEAGARGLIESLPLRVVDAYGNLVDGCSFEVELNGSAFGADGGAAARVAAAGSNRAKLRGGAATFRSVRLAAPADGEYLLRVGSVSRKVAVQEAVVRVKVAQQNLVCGLEVLPACLPPEGSAAAGCSPLLLVVLETEDRQPVPWDDVAAGLTLHLAKPSPGDDAGDAAGAGAVGRGKAGKAAARAAAARRQEAALVLSPECLFEGDHGAEQQQQQLLQELGEAVAEAAAAAAGGGCVACFRAPELTAAGCYTLKAEYRELRPQLVPGLSKDEQLLRSTSHQLHVVAGRAASAALQGGGAEAESLTISNGGEAAARRLLRNAAAQLVDSHGNAAAAPGVALRWRLVCVNGAAGEGGAEGGEAPLLCCSAGEVQQESDERGRAFFGDVAVQEGSGRMGSAAGGQGLQCTLELQVLLARGKPRRGSSASAASWVTAWERPVLFSDDAARIRELQELQERREQLRQRLSAVRDSRAEAGQRVTSAQQEHAAACMAAADKLRVLRTALRQPDLELPDSAAAAQQLVARVKQAAAQELQKRRELEPRYGPPHAPMSQGIARLLTRKDADLVGVFAQLGYVDEPRLSAVLAANYASSLQTVVVKSYEAISRLRAAAKEGNTPIPSMLSYSLIQGFTPEPANCGLNTVMQGVSELAQQLAADACHGTDPPLPIIAPHTRTLALAANQGRPVPPGSAHLAADQWPPGFVGFAVNLIRPRLSNSRQGLLYALIGRTMVFESVDQAASYREYACALRAAVPDIVTLCGGKLSGRGVVLGSSFRVVPVGEAAYRFGTIPAGQQTATQLSATQCEAAAEGLVEALQQRDEAAGELRAAQAAAQEPEQLELQQQQEELQQQLEALEQQGVEGAGRGLRGKHGRHGDRDAAEEAGGDTREAVAADPNAATAAPREGRQQRSSKRKKI